MNCASIFLLFSHKLTQQQIEDLKNMGVENMHYLPLDLQNIWSGIPSKSESIKKIIKPILDWLRNNAKQGDYILVQGDFGVAHLTVEFCFREGFVPIYSVSNRVAVEKREGDKVVKISEFKHVRFRKYERW